MGLKKADAAPPPPSVGPETIHFCDDAQQGKKEKDGGSGWIFWSILAPRFGPMNPRVSARSLARGCSGNFVPSLLLAFAANAAAAAAAVCATDITATIDPVIAIIAVIPDRPAQPMQPLTNRNGLRPRLARSQDVTRKCLKCYNSSVEQEMKGIVTEAV